MIEIRIGACKHTMSWFMLDFVQAYYCRYDKTIHLCRGIIIDCVDIVINHETLHYVMHKLGLSLTDNNNFDKLFPNESVKDREETLLFMDEFGVPKW